MCANHSLWLEQTTRSRVSFNQARPVIPHFANPSPQNTKMEDFNVYKSHIPTKTKALISIECLFVCLCCGLASAPLLNTHAISLFQCSRSAMAKKQTPPIDRPWCYHTGASLNGKPG